jgi:hypothetical protein
MKTNANFWQCLAAIFSEKEIFRTKVVEKIKIHILCSIISFFENHAVYEIMWKNVLETDRPQLTIWRMRFGWWVTKTRDTHSWHIIRIAVPRQQWLRERASMLHLYVHCLSCWNHMCAAQRSRTRRKYLWTFHLQECKLSWHNDIWVATSRGPVHQGFGETAVSIFRVEVSSNVWNWNIDVPLASNNKSFITSFVKTGRLVQKLKCMYTDA